MESNRTTIPRTALKVLLLVLFLYILLFGLSDVSAGQLNPAVTQDNIKLTICKPSWLKAARPGGSFISRLKKDMHLISGAREPVSEYEFDHKVPIGLGGATKDIDNLWLQPWRGKCGAYAKDGKERMWHNRVCSGKALLKDAQDYFLKWECE